MQYNELQATYDKFSKQVRDCKLTGCYMGRGKELALREVAVARAGGLQGPQHPPAVSRFGN